jgi:3-oxoacyl-[acyl-carrier-protein] synthase-1
MGTGTKKLHASNPTEGLAAITGLGIISCLGLNVAEVTRSLQEGRSGIVLDEERRRRGFRSALTGRITGFDPKDWGLRRKHLSTMGEPARYACAAAMDAVKDAGLTPGDLQSERCGLIFGNDSAIEAAVASLQQVEAEGGTHHLGAGHVFKSMNSTVSMNLAAYFGVRGATWCLSAACASSAHALGQALMLIRCGLQDMVLVGGAQETNWQSAAAFDAISAFSLRQEAPAEASRPFDAGRDGLVPSGGAACLVLEELSHAQKRGIPIYGLVRGYGFAGEPRTNLSEPTQTGAVRAMAGALQDGGCAPAAVDYINAHATSTPRGDRFEAAAIAELFGSHTPVSSTKSMTGHECWMAGVSEVVYTTIMAKEGFIAPNRNFTAFEPDFPRIRVVSETTPAGMGLALSNSFGFGGTYASILLDFRA